MSSLIPPYGYFYLYLTLYLALVPAAVFLFQKWRGEGRLRLAAGNVSIFLLLLAGAFVAAEGWFYYCWDTTDGAMVLLSSKRWIDRNVRMNSNGFRGRVLPRGGPKTTAELRIGVVGDSFTFGQGINREEDRFTEVLERRLRNAGMVAAVYNLSHNGLNTQAELDILRFLKDGKISMDIIILAYVPNDILKRQYYSPGYAAARARVEAIGPVLQSFLNHSFVLSFLYHRFTTFNDPAFREYGKMVLSCYEDPAILNPHLGELADFKSRCAELGVSLAVVSFPLFHPLWGWDELAPAYHTMSSFWSTAGVKAVDLWPVLRRYSPRELSVNRYDAHPNVLANRLAAEAIFQNLFAGPDR